MGAKKKGKDDEPEVGTKAEAPAASTEAPAAEEASSKGSITVKYLDHAGKETERTFSKEDHGPDFAKLADEFKATNATRLVK